MRLLHVDSLRHRPGRVALMRASAVRSSSTLPTLRTGPGFGSVVGRGVARFRVNGLLALMAVVYCFYSVLIMCRLTTELRHWLRCVGKRPVRAIRDCS